MTDDHDPPGAQGPRPDRPPDDAETRLSDVIRQHASDLEGHFARVEDVLVTVAGLCSAAPGIAAEEPEASYARLLALRADLDLALQEADICAQYIRFFRKVFVDFIGALSVGGTGGEPRPPHAALADRMERMLWDSYFMDEQRKVFSDRFGTPAADRADAGAAPRIELF